MENDDHGLPVLRPGETCWRIERANNFAVIVDAADYFSTIRAAVLKAQHSVMLIGWDFDTRIELGKSDDHSDGPARLGRFLNWVVRRRPDLKVYILKWDLGMLQALARGATPMMILDWATKKRIRFKLDHAHPTGAAHHQKVVVIDDALAFCGGIDITADRWDTSEHLDDDPRRVRPTSRRRYGPWHDATTAVDGAVARALGELARDRWKRATDEELAPPPPVDSAWPEGLAPMLTDVDVAIARTYPVYGRHRQIHEIEALYLEVIAAAKRTLYIESQYFASRTLAEAMARRLKEPDGPEIVVVNPETADGWLEEKVMGAARVRLLRLIRKADRHGRFKLYTPTAQRGTPIYVHAKVLVMDDRLLRVGSSNLNNRSLGFDTECDLAIEAPPGKSDAKRAQILGLRNDLLAEHLGTGRAAVEGALDRHDGSLIGAIESLRGNGRTLALFDPPEISDFEDEVLGENDLLDPERPARPWKNNRFFKFFAGKSS